MLIYLLRVPHLYLTSVGPSEWVGGWMGRWIGPYSYPLYVKHFKIGSHHSFMIVLMIVHPERVLFGKTNSSGWWWLPTGDDVSLVLSISRWLVVIYYRAIQIESISISLALAGWAFQLDWIRLIFIWSGKESNISWFSISADDLSQKLRYQTWICVFPLNIKKKTIAIPNQSFHTRRWLFGFYLLATLRRNVHPI